MSLQAMTFLVVGATFALYIFIAFRARAATTGEFYVAGKGVHPVLNGMATGADWMSAASFISMAGLIAFKGYDASVFLMGWTGGYCLLAMLLAPYLRKYGKFTVPEFIGDRYYSNAARIVAVLCLITASLTYVIGQMKGIGVAFSRFLELPFETGLFVGMAIVFIYAVLGGMKGITYTQIAQYCVLIFAYTVPAIFISLQLTGMPIPQLGLGSTMAGSETFLLDRLDKTLMDLGFNQYTTRQGGMLNILLYTFSLMIGTAGLPHVIMRFFTVPKVKDARSSVGWSLVFISILYTTAPAVGAMARLNLMETIHPTSGPNAGVWLEYEKRPTWFKNWEKTGLLKFEDKNGDGRIQYVGKNYKDANGQVVENEMVKVDRDIMVLANPEIAKLPNWVIALVAAGGIAAALSTAAGLLLAIASSISHDILKGVMVPDMTEKSELLASRIAMAGAIGVAGYFGLHPPGFAAQVVALAFGLAASSIFPALMMGIFVKRVNNIGAVCGMLSGLGITLVYIFWFKGWFFFPGTNMAPNDAAHWFLGISPEAFGAVGAMVNFAVAYIVSGMTPPPPEHIQHLVDDIRQPGIIKR
ncbi:MAG: sodium:solute symporter family protein [Thermodesulfobacteriota bacterium]|nr:sodium:solute symporter family protein [Thermodesulfobacteriota bacterium]